MKLNIMLLISLLLATSEAQPMTISMEPAFGMEAAVSKKCTKCEAKFNQAEKKFKAAEKKFNKCQKTNCPSSPSPLAPPSPPLAPPSPVKGTFTSKDSLKEAVQAFNKKPSKAEKKYGPIAGWDVSGITDMNELFSGMANFNADISNWDTSGVTSMGEMFKDAKNFNQLVSFDTSSVTYMYGMFMFAEVFNQPVSFDTSSATAMSFMFYEAKAFNQRPWFDLSSAEDMGFMFTGSSLSAANRLLIRCAWAGTPAFDNALPPYDEIWAPGSCL